MRKIRQLITKHEGYRQHAYLDSLGYTTIGIGRCIAPGSKGLSKLEASFLLSNDIDECLADLKTFPWFDGLNEARQAALCDMRFNLGPSRLRRFEKMLAAIEAGDFVEASKQALASQWANQVGRRSKTIAKMIESGEWP